MRGFGKFGAQDTQLQHLSEDDFPDDTVENGKLEEKIVFIRKCCNLGSAEDEIRQLGQNFQDQFTGSLDEDKQSYVEQVGKTEWVLIKTDFMRWIQQGYRNRSMNSMNLFGVEFCPTGQEFSRQIRSLWVDHCHLNPGQQTHNVDSVKFPSTDFSFIESIQPP